MTIAVDHTHRPTKGGTHTLTHTYHQNVGGCSASLLAIKADENYSALRHIAYKTQLVPHSIHSAHTVYTQFAKQHGLAHIIQPGCSKAQQSELHTAQKHSQLFTVGLLLTICYLQEDKKSNTGVAHMALSGAFGNHKN